MHDQLADLEQRREQAHATAREARDKRTRWEAEAWELRGRTEGMQPGPELDALKAEITARDRSRVHGEGEYADAYQAALEPFHKADQALQAFKRRNIRGLLEESVGGVDESVERIMAGWQAILQGCSEYAAATARAHELVVSVDIFDGHDLAFDGRINEWRQAAESALDGDDVGRPRLSDMGSWKADNRGN
jgi:hypothetical protein